MGQLPSFDTSPAYVRRFALLVAAVAVVVGGVIVYRAAHNEFTGTATYHRPTGFKSWTAEAVTRESAPAKFRSATNSLWVLSVACLSVSAIGFTFFRKLDDCVDGP